MNQKLRFCERFVWLDGGPIRFENRPYLPAIYGAQGNLVVRASRQTEKSTFLINTILFEAFTHAGIQILFVTPREEQGAMLIGTRLIPVIGNSPVLRRELLGRPTRRLQERNLNFANGSRVFVRSAFHNADGCRGLSADTVLVDEFQDIAPGNLPVIQEVTSHAANPRTILTGTPKLQENHLETMFHGSTACRWTLSCPCGQQVILDERCLGREGIVCPDCQQPLDVTQGRWVPRNPDSTWGAGFWINYPMVPWCNYDVLLERQQSYGLALFKNEVLGLPTLLGDHIVTEEEMKACCSEREMTRSLGAVPADARHRMVAGIDWGGGVHSRTLLTIGYMRSDYTFEVCWMEALRADEDPDRVTEVLATRCREFRVRWIGADGGGNGHVYNRLLFDKFNGCELFFAILYSQSEQQPRRDGVLWKWTVDRSASIGSLFSRIKKRIIQFPRMADVGQYLGEFTCEMTIHDDEQRTVRYTHPENQPDDALHATNYALLVAIYTHRAAQEQVYV